MTAEIAVMNKMGIALAADSAVTVSEGGKVYNTANKLFQLSKYHPVGVMIYGNAEYMGYPWETLIKVYKNHLAEKELDTVDEYANDFINFIESKQIISNQIQEFHFTDKVYDYFTVIKINIDRDIKEEILKHGSITTATSKKISNNIIIGKYESWNSLGFLSCSNETDCENIKSKYDELLEGIIADAFEKLPTSKSIINKLKSIAAFLYCKKRVSSENSGIVIAGFGKEEIFPSLVEMHIEEMVNNKIKHYKKLAAFITHEDPAGVFSFAQNEMVKAFMNGIDPEFHGVLIKSFSNVYQTYTDALFEGIDIPDEAVSVLESRFSKLQTKACAEFSELIHSYGAEMHSSPIMAAVGCLPKDEIASMAESLVNITSFKRRITLGAETVGGPIDVAVISKGDGFVWVKRK